MVGVQGETGLSAVLETARRRPPVRRLDLVQSKLDPPAVRPGIVGRASLVERLRAARTASVVEIVAPAGYGKTTLLAQWAARDRRPFAWVSADEGDNDPRALLTYVAAAVDRIEPLDPRIFETLARRGGASWRTVVSRLGSAIASLPPLVIVVDDVHLLGESGVPRRTRAARRAPGRWNGAGARRPDGAGAPARTPARAGAPGRDLDPRARAGRERGRCASERRRGQPLGVGCRRARREDRGLAGRPLPRRTRAARGEDRARRCRLRRRRPVRRRLPPPRGALPAHRRRSRVRHARGGAGSPVRAALRRGSRAERARRSCSSGWSGRASTSSRSTTGGSGIGSTTCFATC